MKKHEALALSTALALRKIYTLPLGKYKGTVIPSGKYEYTDGDPIGKGVHDATTDLEKLELLYDLAAGISPTLHVGIHVGASGYVVLDIDDVCKMRCSGGSKCKPEHPRFDEEGCSWTKECKFEGQGRHGHHGSDQLVEWESLHGKLPRTPVTITPSGGRHLWFKMPLDRVIGSKKIATLPCVDIKGMGGYVVAVGVTNSKGSYVWQDDWEFEAAAELPVALLEQLGSAAQRGTENDLDQLDPITRAHFEYLRTLGWVPAGSEAMKKGTNWDEYDKDVAKNAWHIDLSHPCHATFPSVCGSLGQRNPGRFVSFTESWQAGPNGEVLPTFQAYRQEEVERFVKTGSTELRLKEKGPQLVEVARTRSLRDSLLTLKQLSKLEPPKYLIDKYLTQGGLSMMYAGAGVGKSFLAIDWMMHLAAGLDWQGHKVSQVSVFYIAAEGQSGLQLRTAAWEQEHPDVEIADEDVTILPVAVNLASTDINELVEILDEYKPGLVVIDTLARTSAGADGNSDKDMGIVIANATTIQQRTGAAVLILHHVGHIEKDRPRGSSALGGAMDSMFQLIGGTTEGITLTVTKQKDDEEAQPFKIRMKKVPLEGIFDASGVQRTSLVLVSPEDDEVDVEDDGTKVDPKLLKVVEVLWRKQLSPQHGLTATEWRDAVHHDINMNKNTFFDYKKLAVQQGFVTQIGDARTSPFAASRNPFEDHKIVVTLSEREANA